MINLFSRSGRNKKNMNVVTQSKMTDLCCLCEISSGYYFMRIFDEQATNKEHRKFKNSKSENKEEEALFNFNKNKEESIRTINYLLKLSSFDNSVRLENDSLILGCKCMVPMHKSCIAKLIIFTQNTYCQSCNTSLFFKDNDSLGVCEKASLLKYSSKIAAYFILLCICITIIAIFYYFMIDRLGNSEYGNWGYLLLLTAGIILLAVFIEFMIFMRHIANQKVVKSLDVSEFSGITDTTTPEYKEKIRINEEILTNFLKITFDIKIDDIAEYKILSKYNSNKKSLSDSLNKYVYVESLSKEDNENDNENENVNDNENNDYDSVNDNEEHNKEQHSHNQNYKNENYIQVLQDLENHDTCRNKDKILTLNKSNNHLEKEQSIKSDSDPISEKDSYPIINIKNVASYLDADNRPTKVYIQAHKNYLINLNNTPVNPILQEDPNKIPTKIKSSKSINSISNESSKSINSINSDSANLSSRRRLSSQTSESLNKFEMKLNKSKKQKRNSLGSIGNKGILSINKELSNNGIKLMNRPYSNKNIKKVSMKLRRPSKTDLIEFKYMKNVNQIDEEKFKETPENSISSNDSNKNSFNNFESEKDDSAIIASGTSANQGTLELKSILKNHSLLCEKATEKNKVTIKEEKDGDIGEVGESPIEPSFPARRLDAHEDDADTDLHREVAERWNNIEFLYKSLLDS